MSGRRTYILVVTFGLLVTFLDTRTALDTSQGLPDVLDLSPDLLEPPAAFLVAILGVQLHVFLGMRNLLVLDFDVSLSVFFSFLGFLGTMGLLENGQGFQLIQDSPSDAPKSFFVGHFGGLFWGQIFDIKNPLDTENFLTQKSAIFRILWP